MRVSGHVPAFMTAGRPCARVRRDPARELSLPQFLVRLGAGHPDARPVTAVAERAASLDLGSAVCAPSSMCCGAIIPSWTDDQRLREPAGRRKERSIRATRRSRPGAAVVRRGFLAGGLPVPEGKDQRYHDSFQTMLRFLKQLHDAGIPIVAGTDAFAGSRSTASSSCMSRPAFRRRRSCASPRWAPHG